MKDEKQGISIVEHDNHEEAVRAAAEEAVTSMATAAPAVVYRQGNRLFVTTAFPFSYVAEKVRLDSSRRGEDPDGHYNRPLMPEHHRGITKYVLSRQDYILPALSLCVQGRLRCHVSASTSSVRAGIIVLPASAAFQVSDGQHRVKGVQDALRQLDHLGEDGISATIAAGADLEQVHSDFYDCAQTRPIPPSLLAMYNRYDPISRLVRELSEEVRIFHGRIDKVSRTVGKSTIFIWTANQLKSSLSEMLIGDSTTSSTRSASESREKLKSDVAYAEAKAFAVHVYESFSESNPEWYGLLSKQEASESQDLHLLREQYLSLTGTGLCLIGRLGLAIHSLPAAERTKIIRAAAQMDWSRSAEPWRGTVVTDDGRVLSQRAPIQLASTQAKKLLGLPLLRGEERRLAKAA